MIDVMTVEELYGLPDDGLHHELLAGHLLSEPPPGTRHGLAVAAVAALLQEWVASHGDGVVLAGDSGFILARSPDTLRGPDVAWISQERFDEVGPVATAFPGSPDLAVEVLSPGDRAADVHAKVADYLAAGTRLVWLVDPENRRVTAYRQLLAPRFLSGDDRLTDEDVLPGLEANVDRLFAAVSHRRSR
jgi:Uma2 family endonuclease